MYPATRNNKPPIPVVDRFWSKLVTEPNTGCWLWIGALTDAGYGELYGGRDGNGKRTVLSAHRLSYELEHGTAIQPGFVVDHICRVRCCVNPRHLRLLTLVENLQAKGSLSFCAGNRKVTCKRGHNLEEHGKVKVYGGYSRRNCTLCARERDKSRHRSELNVLA